MADFCTYKAKRTSSGENFDGCTNQNYVLTDYVLSKIHKVCESSGENFDGCTNQNYVLSKIHKVCESCPFDSGPEVFVCVSRNYVLNEKDCVIKNVIKICRG